LPWPKRCSRSAGVSAKRTASNVMTDAARSSSESASEPSNATEPLAAYAHAFMMISTSATVTDAPPARRIKRPRSPDSAACMALDVPEPRRGGAQRLLLVRETEAHERRSGRRLGAEHRDRDRGDAVLRGQAARELGIGLGRDSPVVRELEIGALGRLNLESRAREQLDEEIPLLAIELRERQVVLGPLSHEVRERMLQRGHGAEREVLVDLAQLFAQRARRDGIADLPSRRVICLAEREYGERALLELRMSEHRRVPAVEHDVLVHLVA